MRGSTARLLWTEDRIWACGLPGDIMEAGLLDKLDSLQAELSRHRPFGPDLINQVRNYYRVGLVYTSNALEGITYTESETKVLIEDGLTAGGRPLKEAYAVVGHAEAYSHMFSLLAGETVTEKDILKFHSLLERGLENEAVAGKYRNVQSFISGSKYPLTLPENIPAAMRAFIHFIESQRDSMHPVELAAKAHKELVFIHPFADGNGRVSRLVMNTLLIQRGYLPAIIPPILRSDYIAALEKAHEDDSDFLTFIVEREIETQKEMLRLLGGKL